MQYRPGRNGPPLAGAWKPWCADNEVKVLILLASPEAVAPNGSPDIDLVGVLKRADDQGNAVFVVSNHPRPAWFEDVFAGSAVQFETVQGRQDGRLIKVIAEKLRFEPFSVLVLAASREDVRYGEEWRRHPAGGGLVPGRAGTKPRDSRC
jgi:hypothetical protein